MRFSTAIIFVAVVFYFNYELCAARGSQEPFDQIDIEKMEIFNATLDAERTGAMEIKEDVSSVETQV